MTANGSVWVTVVQLSQEEEEFHRLHGRYGELVEMTNLLAGPAPDVMAGGRLIRNHNKTAQQRIYSCSESRV